MDHHVRQYSTRSSDVIRHWLYELRWPNQTRKTLIRALSFFRDLINMYAGHPSAKEEGATYEAFPVPRIRTPRLPSAPVQGPAVADH